MFLSQLEEEVEIFVVEIKIGSFQMLIVFFRTKTGLQKLLICLTITMFLGLRVAICEYTQYSSNKMYTYILCEEYVTKAFIS